MFCVPLNVPAFGAAVTVTVLVAVALAHAPVPVTVYVMVAVPAATPVTTPVLLFTIATAVLLDVQVPPTSPFLVNVTEPLEQISCVPLTVPAFGATATVTVLVAVASAHPPVPVTV
jgi:hypothetical protein